MRASVDVCVHVEKKPHQRVSAKLANAQLHPVRGLWMRKIEPTSGAHLPIE